MNKLIIICSVIVILSSCGMIKGSTKSKAFDNFIKSTNNIYIDDNVYEEVLEELIENNTGLIIDFTPVSKEDIKTTP